MSDEDSVDLLIVVDVGLFAHVEGSADISGYSQRRYWGLEGLAGWGIAALGDIL